jgi:L-threonylcarbamoyladenylate synthase
MLTRSIGVQLQGSMETLRHEQMTLRLSTDPAGIARACAFLAEGQTVAMPTETVYGLAADARDGQAVARIYEAKGRPSFNPLIVHLPDLAAAERVAEFTPEVLALAQAFWPGALTLVLPLRHDAGIASLVTAGLPTIALRVPAHPVAQNLLRQFGGPVAAPSANASGRISPTTADHVLDPDGGLDGRIAAVLDAGPCPVGVESTIIGWEAALQRPLHDFHANPSAPNAPGQMTSHYAPKAAIRLNAESVSPDETLISFGKDGPFSLSETGDLAEAAANLFEMLRRADRAGRPIAVAPIPDHGLGAAINDRLRRAAAPRD